MRAAPKVMPSVLIGWPNIYSVFTHVAKSVSLEPFKKHPKCVPRATEDLYSCVLVKDMGIVQINGEKC